MYVGDLAMIVGDSWAAWQSARMSNAVFAEPIIVTVFTWVNSS
jgi:hypothetical protein